MANNTLKIDGSYLEGGGQILRTALGLSVVFQREIEIFSIRKNRRNPGLAHQHLGVIKALERLTGSSCKGAYLGSSKIVFTPRREFISSLEINLFTSASIGLLLQALLIPMVIMNKALTLSIEGGTAGKWAPPIDYYPEMIFPLLGIEAELKILRRGYYPKGGGKISLEIKGSHPKPLYFPQRKELSQIKIMSFASQDLRKRKVAQRQAQASREYLQDKFTDVEISIFTDYYPTYSLGAEVNLKAIFKEGVFLWADALGEKGKPAEEVGKEAAKKLERAIISGANCDSHTADNIIPYLYFYGGEFITEEITLHTLTNIWICEQFEGKRFKIDGHYVGVPR